MKSIFAAILIASAANFLPAQSPIPAALQSMADTERAFAESCTRKGIRDSFLEYFADDAVAFSPAPISAKERLRSRPARPFSEAELRWEPRLGDVAASGELGWLTGPSTFIDHTSKEARPQAGNYLSVWRREANGSWRVFIDVGSQPPNPVSFAPGLTRLEFPGRYAGSDSQEQASASLVSADRALNAAAAGNSGDAYGPVTIGASRLHRSGFMPTIGPTAIGAWMRQHMPSMNATTGTARAARSGDLGYSYGTLEASSAKPAAYVRVWQRDAGGKWLVVADVTQ